MKLEQLVRAVTAYELHKKTLDHKRYVQLDLFRDFFPDMHRQDGPFRITTLTGEMLDILSVILAGQRASDGMMKELFGFTNEEFEAAIRDANPVIKPLPDKLVLITLDDSTLDHYMIACPVLERYGGRANLFTCEMDGSAYGRADFSDKEKFMTWGQIRELYDRGHEIVNHSLHHNCDFTKADAATIINEIRGLEERCLEHGIRKPTAVGYPRGSCNPSVEKLIHDLGYYWGRGDMKETSPMLIGNMWYDPYYNTPLVIPGLRPRNLKELAEAVRATANNKVIQLIYHEVTDEAMLKTEGMTFPDIVGTIYSEGGQCITYGQLSEYVDPVKAYHYTHPSPV